MQTRTVLFAGNGTGQGGRRVPLEDRGGKQVRQRTGRLDDMPYADPAIMEELSNERKLAGRVGRHSSRNPMTNIPFSMSGDVPDSSQRIAPPLPVNPDGYPEAMRPDAIENADWLIREPFRGNMPADYLEVAKRLEQQLGDYRNSTDTWYGGDPEITVAPLMPQIELPVATPHESDNYAAEVHHVGGSDWNRVTGTQQLAGIDWESSFAQSRGLRGNPYTDMTSNQVDALNSMVAKTGVEQRRTFIFSCPADYVNQQTALTSKRIGVDETFFMRPKSWTKRKSMFTHTPQEQVLAPSMLVHDANLQVMENHPFENQNTGYHMGADNHLIDTAWDRFSKVRVIPQMRPTVEQPEVRHTTAPPMLPQVATIDPRGLTPRPVMERDEYGSVLDMGMLSAQKVQKQGLTLNETTFQANVAARRGLFNR